MIDWGTKFHKTVIFKNEKQVKKYYKKEDNTYYFRKGKEVLDVKFIFNFETNANIVAGNIWSKYCFKARKINAEDIKACSIEALEIHAESIYVTLDIKAKNIIVEDFIHSGDIEAENINAYSIYCCNLFADTVIAIDIKVCNMKVKTIEAKDYINVINKFNAKTVKTKNLYAADIQAKDISAYHVTAWCGNVKADAITPCYTCIASGSVTCKKHNCTLITGLEKGVIIKETKKNKKSKKEGEK